MQLRLPPSSFQAFPRVDNVVELSLTSSGKTREVAPSKNSLGKGSEEGREGDAIRRGRATSPHGIGRRHSNSSESLQLPLPHLIRDDRHKIRKDRLPNGERCRDSHDTA